MRHASLLRRLPNAARDLVHDDVVMRGIAAQQASEADDGVVFLGFSESAGSGRNLEGTGHAEDFDVPLFCPGSYKSVVGAAEQAVSYEFIETRDDNSEPKSGCVQFSGDRKSTRLNSSHITISYAVFCLKKKKKVKMAKEYPHILTLSA